VAGVADIDAGGMSVADGQLRHLGLGVAVLLGFDGLAFGLTPGVPPLDALARLVVLGLVVLVARLSALATTA
jgi:hypothetical protein